MCLAPKITEYSNILFVSFLDCYISLQTVAIISKICVLLKIILYLLRLSGNTVIPCYISGLFNHCFSKPYFYGASFIFYSGE